MRTSRDDCDAAVVRKHLTQNRLLALVVVAAIGVGAALIVVSLRGGNDGGTGTVGVQGGVATSELLKGIPQNGNVLGDPKAPVTLVEYADYQCPYCAHWALGTFPTIVSEYVRPGKVKVVFNGVAFLGPDSLTALKTAFSAGEQNRFWNVNELLFHNQGEENKGWVTEDLLRGIGNSVPGLDTEAMLASRDDPKVITELARAQAAAQTAGFATGPTPSFEIGPSGGPMKSMTGALPIDEFRNALDAALQQ